MFYYYSFGAHCKLKNTQEDKSHKQSINNDFNSIILKYITKRQEKIINGICYVRNIKQFNFFSVSTSKIAKRVRRPNIVRPTSSTLSGNFKTNFRKLQVQVGHLHGRT